MGFFKRPHAFDPLDMEIIDTVFLSMLQKGRRTEAGADFWKLITLGQKARVIKKSR